VILQVKVYIRRKFGVRNGDLLEGVERCIVKNGDFVLTCYYTKNYAGF